MTLEQRVGQVLMIGVSGDSVTPEMVRLFRETYAGGLILYRPNFRSAEGLKQMISELEGALERRLLVAVDHEGGRVIHLAEGITVFPDNLALGMTGNEAYAAGQGRIEAAELRRLGIDINLAPTVDVLTDEFSPNIGIRSYAKDAELVARLGVARIQAMQAGGLSACAKHFPGQGHSSLDAHLKLPLIPTTWEEMKAVHIKPFEAAIRAGVHTVMSSHPVYVNLEPEFAGPATFSRRIIHDFLRLELNFQGVILSDDLEMGALKDLCAIGESACRTMRAGHDMVLVCHNPQAVREVFQTLFANYRDGKLDQRELESSVKRIEVLKKQRNARFEAGALHPEPEGKALAQKIAREAVRVSEEHRMIDSKFPEKGEKTVVIFPRLSELNRLIFIEREMLDEKAFVENLFAAHGIDAAVEVVELDPLDREIEQALRAAKTGAAIFFCYDAHLFSQTKKLLEKLQLSCPRLAVVLLRDPYDAAWVRKEAICLNVFGFRAVQICAAVERLRRIIAKDKVEPCPC